MFIRDRGDGTFPHDKLFFAQQDIFFKSKLHVMQQLVLTNISLDLSNFIIYI